MNNLKIIKEDPIEEEDEDSESDDLLLDDNMLVIDDLEFRMIVSNFKKDYMQF